MKEDPYYQDEDVAQWF